MSFSRGGCGLGGWRARVIGLAVVVAALAAGPAQAQQHLMMADSAAANFRMVLFSPVDGSVVNSNYFPLNGATNSVPIHAMQVGNEIWVSEQIGDRVARYDLVGTYLGQIGGGAAGGMDNIRGMGLVGNTVYVTNGGAGNGSPGASSVLMFDTTGSPQGNFLTVALAPSPFSVLAHQGGILVGSSGANDDIHRFSLAGASSGTFYNSTLSFIEQLDHAANGDVLAAVFTSGVVARLDPNTGAQISTFPASGARGVHQLGNGNIMWTSGAGVSVYDVGTSTSTNVYATAGGRYIDVLTIPTQPTGVCCRGATCNASIAAASCLGSGAAGAIHVVGAACNSGGSTVTPCCYADYNKAGGVGVADIFAFLTDWFGLSPNAIVGGDGVTGTPTVTHIFAFLTAWFAGC